MPRPLFRRPVVVRVIIAAVVVGSVALLSGAKQPQTTVGMRVLNRTLGLVSRYAEKRAPDDSLLVWAARGIVRELRDPYAALFSAKELAAFERENLRNSYAGLGVSLLTVRDETRIGSVFAGSPAEAQGIEPGTRIVQVDDWVVGKVPTDSVVNHLLGPVGTAVNVLIEPRAGGTPTRYTIRRGRIRPPAVPFTVVLDGSVGYIPLRSFNDRSAADVSAAVTALRREGATRFVLDVRDNGGGSVDQAIDVVNVFLPAGRDVLVTRSRSDAEERTATRRPGDALTEPLAVLINEASASASEIVAGALQDHDRALVLGTTSFGKGLVQGVFPMEDGYALKLTTARWYTPLGRPLHRDRHLTSDDRLVADRPDSVESIDGTAGRPPFTTAAGRTVFGGGGIVPDVIVATDTLSDGDLRFVRALGGRATALQYAAFDLARSLPAQTGPVVVRDEWRAQVLAALRQDGVSVSDDDFAKARGFVDYVITQQVARLFGGERSVFDNLLSSDRQLAAARRQLVAAPSQQALFAAVDRSKGKG
jgi:carboxyl-terminal processing protease